MTPDHLTALLVAGKADTLAFKETTGSRRETMQTGCGMLPHRGGHVLCGVTTQGRTVGQTIGNKTIEDALLQIQRIDQPALPDIERDLIVSGQRVMALCATTGSGISNGRGLCWNRHRKFDPVS